METSKASGGTFFHQAAKASWATGLIVFLLIIFGSRTGLKLVVELVGFLLMVGGFVLGVIALFGVRKYGAQGILAPAIVGIIINGLLLFIFITNFITARSRALERRGGPPAKAVMLYSSENIPT